jgi:hypothetical protein
MRAIFKNSFRISGVHRLLCLALLEIPEKCHVFTSSRRSTGRYLTSKLHLSVEGILIQNVSFIIF